MPPGNYHGFAEGVFVFLLLFPAYEILLKFMTSTGAT
jgi:hypothetical protein